MRSAAAMERARADAQRVQYELARNESETYPPNPPPKPASVNVSGLPLAYSSAAMPPLPSAIPGIPGIPGMPGMPGVPFPGVVPGAPMPSYTGLAGMAGGMSGNSSLAVSRYLSALGGSPSLAPTTPYLGADSSAAAAALASSLGARGVPATPAALEYNRGGGVGSSRSSAALADASALSRLRAETAARAAAAANGSAARLSRTLAEHGLAYGGAGGEPAAAPFIPPYAPPAAAYARGAASAAAYGAPQGFQPLGSYAMRYAAGGGVSSASTPAPSAAGDAEGGKRPIRPGPLELLTSWGREEIDELADE